MSIELIDVRRELTSASGGKRKVPSLLIAVCLCFLAVVTVMAAFGPAIIGRDPNAENLLHSLSGPTAAYPLGTDGLGRDVLARTIAGARTALGGPLVIAVGSMLIGGFVGLTAGYRGGWYDSIILRIVDLLYALPGLLVAVVVVGVLGGGYGWAVVILTLLFSPIDIRLVRAATLEQRALPYVEASRVLGLSKTRIMATVILPNILPVVVANTCLNFAYALVSLAALAYLGLGVSAGAPDWGLTLSDNQIYLFADPLIVAIPAVMIVLTAASMNLLGDWLFERLSRRGESGE